MPIPIQRAARCFDWFLFESCDPRIASLLRIGYGILLIVYVLVWMLDGPLWFSDEGVLRTSTVRQLNEHSSIFSIALTKVTPLAVRICLAVLFGQAVLLTLGCWSRLQAGCVFIWLAAFQDRNPMIVDGEDTVFRWFAFLMIFLPLDHVWSLARRITGKLSLATCEHAWGLRLIQIQIAAIYLSSVACKLCGETWRDGTALFFVARLDDYFGRFWVPDALFETSWSVQTMTWSVLAIELLVPLTIWFPRCRMPALLSALVMHLAIEYSMNLFLFQWIMILGLMSFVKLPQAKGISNAMPV